MEVTKLKESSTSVIMLGGAGVKLRVNDRCIYIDPLNSISEEPVFNHSDIILVTHDDADHFLPSRFKGISEFNIPIICPPSVAVELIQSGVADLNQLNILSTKDNSNPAVVKIGDDIQIFAFQTEHFLGWRPIHNSYLIEIAGERIYITGDSILDKKMQAFLGTVDFILCNLVDEGFIKCIEDKRHAVYHLMSYILRIKCNFNPTWIIGAHLINFDGAVDENDMHKIVSNSEIEGILIPTTREEYHLKT